MRTNADNKQRILRVAPYANEKSGIYIFYREEDGIKYAYVGQAKRILTRLAQHLEGYDQHIDLSLRKHGLWSEENPTGYRIKTMYCSESSLDDSERFFIKTYASYGYQMRNKADNKPSKGYYDGVRWGYDKARKEIKHLFDLHLTAAIKSNKPNKVQEKALQKFKDFLSGGEETAKG